MVSSERAVTNGTMVQHGATAHARSTIGTVAPRPKHQCLANCAPARRDEPMAGRQRLLANAQRVTQLGLALVEPSDL